MTNNQRLYDKIEELVLSHQEYYTCNMVLLIHARKDINNVESALQRLYSSVTENLPPHGFEEANEELIGLLENLLSPPSVTSNEEPL